MPYKISYDPEACCVFTVFEGTVDLETYQRFADEFAKVSSSHDCLTLFIDMRTAKLSMSILEIYAIPQIMAAAGVSPICKKAVVVPHITEDYQFFETVCANSGQLLKVFTDYDSAIRWLMISSKAIHHVVNRLSK